MNKVKFFFDSLRKLKTRGTITPTSKFTSQQILKHISFPDAQVIVELGAGDGCITKHLLSQLREDAVLICFEIDPNLCKTLNQLNDPRLIIIQDSAEHLNQYLASMNLKYADAIVSGIPFIVLPDELRDSILLEVKKVLKPGGPFIQFHYSPIPRKRYRAIFEQVKVGLEVRNVPPAFVFVCA